MSIFQNNPIIDWMDYIFYRATKFYLRHKEEFEEWGGYIVASGPLAWWILSITFVLIGVMGFDLSKKAHIIIILVGCCFSLIVLHDRYTDKKVYDKLSIQYKDELHHKVKGVAVVATILLSFALFVMALYLEHILVAKG